jgi:hypothetical protein
MAEILTESFCERCGTRYTFESAAPTKTKKLGKFKTLSKGLKNYVLSDDTSMDEAMAAARSDEERELTSQQLDAFHSTFNFCMTCRQYTCGNCWNQVEGRCLTCAPHLGHEIMPAQFPDLSPLVPAESLQFDAAAWPASDLLADAPTETPDLDEILAAGRLDRLTAAPSAEETAPIQEAALVAESPTDALAETAPVETAPDSEADAGMAWPLAAEAAAAEAAAHEIATAPTWPEEEPLIAAAHVPVEATPEPEPAVAEAGPVEAAPVEATAPIFDIAPIAADQEELPTGLDDRAAAAAQRTSDLLAKFRPGQNIDAELEAFEAIAAAETEPVVAKPVAHEPAAAAAFTPEVAWPVAADEAVDAAPAADLVAAGAATPAVAPEWPDEHVAAPELVAAEAPEEIETAAESTWEPEVAAAPLAAQVAAEPARAAEEIAAEAVPDEIAAVAAPEYAAEGAPELAAAAELSVPESAPEPQAAPEPEPVRADVVEQPTWRIVAPDVPAPVTNGHPPVPEPAIPAVAATAPPPLAVEPQWPAAPQWPASQPSPAVLASRRTSASAATEALWAASARDVVSNPPGAPVLGVQPCSNCGLSLSATARFCRRCGSRQGA